MATPNVPLITVAAVQDNDEKWIADHAKIPISSPLTLINLEAENIILKFPAEQRVGANERQREYNRFKLLANAPLFKKPPFIHSFLVEKEFDFGIVRAVFSSEHRENLKGTERQRNEQSPSPSCWIALEIALWILEYRSIREVGSFKATSAIKATFPKIFSGNNHDKLIFAILKMWRTLELEEAEFYSMDMRLRLFENFLSPHLFCYSCTRSVGNFPKSQFSRQYKSCLYQATRSTSKDSTDNFHDVQNGFSTIYPLVVYVCKYSSHEDGPCCRWFFLECLRDRRTGKYLYIPGAVEVRWYPHIVRSIFASQNNESGIF